MESHSIIAEKELRISSSPTTIKYNNNESLSTIQKFLLLSVETLMVTGILSIFLYICSHK